jgi:pimeloyl-ACP methyl ester carboxylesterase
MLANNYATGKECFLKIGENQFNIQQDGRPEGTPIVLIHALAGSLKQWEESALALAKNHWVIRIDLLGHGDSDKPENGDYTMPAQAHRVAQIVSLLGANAFFAVGQSGGGNVVVALLEDRILQKRVIKAVVIGTPPNIRYVKLPILAQIYSVPLLGKLMWRITTMKMARDTMQQLFAPDFGAVPDVFPADFLRMERHSYVKGKAGVEDYIRERDFTKRIGNSTAPFLVIFGAADQWVQPIATEQWTRESRAIIHLLPNIGHTPPAECPEKVASIVEEFVGNSMN